MKKNHLITIFCVLLLALVVEVNFYIGTVKTDLARAYSSKPINGHSWTEMECSEGLCVTAGNKVGIGTDSPTEKLQVVGNLKVTGDICNSSGNCLSALANITNACGPAAKTYTYDATAFTGAFCLVGNPTPASPSFPSAGSSTNWTCPVVSGSPISCTATRSSPPTPLVNGTHNVVQCTGSGGVVYSNFCMFNSSSCPGGWTQYLSWSATTSVSCSVPYGAGYCCGGTRSCTTSGHGFSNASVESCSVSWATYCSDTSCTPNPQPVCQCGSSQTCSSTITHVGCY